MKLQRRDASSAWRCLLAAAAPACGSSWMSIAHWQTGCGLWVRLRSQPGAPANTPHPAQPSPAQPAGGMGWGNTAGRIPCRGRTKQREFAAWRGRGTTTTSASPLQCPSFWTAGVPVAVVGAWFFFLAMCMRRERPNEAMFCRMHRSRIPSVEKAMGCTSAHEAAGRQAGRHGLALNIRKGGVQLH